MILLLCLRVAEGGYVPLPWVPDDFSQFCSVGMNAMFVSLFPYCLSVCFLCFYGPCCLIQNEIK